MAFEYRRCDRSQQFLMPPDVRDWLRPGHPAWFVLDVVAGLDTAELHKRHRRDGVGRAAYNPDTLLAVILYGYMQGVRSSRQVERLCEVDVAFRVLCANDGPDHSTVARFLAANDKAIADLFGQVLAMCAEQGMVKLGVVALDGTKIAANASAGKNRTRQRLQEQAARLVQESIETDVAEDARHGTARGDELPAELADPATRANKIKELLERVDRDDPPPDPPEPPAARPVRQPRPEVIASGRRPHGRQRDDVDQVAEAEAVLARILADQQQAAASAKERMYHHVDPDQHFRVEAARRDVERARERMALIEAREGEEDRQQAATADAVYQKKLADHGNRVINKTDPDSRLQPTKNGWVQGYNAQAVTSRDQIVIAADVGTNQADVGQFEPMLNAAVGAAAALPRDPEDNQIGTLLADTGYWSAHNVTLPGPDRLIATGKTRAMAALPDTQGAPEREATLREQMTHRLGTEHGRTLYRQRGTTIEAVFGQIKEAMRVRRFRRRGHTAARHEWRLICLAHNLRKLHLNQLVAA